MADRGEQRDVEGARLFALFRGWSCAVASVMVAVGGAALIGGAGPMQALAASGWGALASAALSGVYGVPVAVVAGRVLGRRRAGWLGFVVLTAAGVAGVALVVPVLDARFDVRLFAETWWLGAVAGAGGWLGLRGRWRCTSSQVSVRRR
jgi:hypothetical protein